MCKDEGYSIPNWEAAGRVDVCLATERLHPGSPVQISGPWSLSRGLRSLGWACGSQGRSRTAGPAPVLPSQRPEKIQSPGGGEEEMVPSSEAVIAPNEEKAPC